MNEVIRTDILISVQIQRLIYPDSKRYNEAQHFTLWPKRSLMLSIPYRIIVGLASKER